MAILPPDIAGSLETYIRREFSIAGSDESIFRDEHLFEAGYVDSAGVVELIMFIESTFNVKLEDHHVFSEQFTTINGIAELVSDCAPRDAAGHARARAPVR